MTNLQFQNDLDRLTEVLPEKVKKHITYEKMEDVIEIVLDIGRTPEIRHAGGKIEYLGDEFVTEDDIIIAISHSGESRELIDILNYSKRFGIKLISITKNPDSSLGKAGDIVLRLPLSKEACPLGLAPTSSTTATLVLGDILTVAMIERKGFSKTQFNQRHPGGKLGSILQKVKDIMHTGDEMPILKTNATINEIILEMTSKRLGCVGFVDDNNNFCGMFTDGDLRRCINKDLKNAKAQDIMTKDPITVSKDLFASEAIKILNEKKITNLFVVEDNKAIGVIHIHDLLKSGVA